MEVLAIIIVAALLVLLTLVVYLVISRTNLIDKQERQAYDLIKREYEIIKSTSLSKHEQISLSIDRKKDVVAFIENSQGEIAEANLKSFLFKIRSN